MTKKDKAHVAAAIQKLVRIFGDISDTERKRLVEEAVKELEQTGKLV